VDVIDMLTGQGQVVASVLEFAAGATNLSIPLTIIDDAVVEGNETILLSLTNSAAGWSTQVPLTILDDDTGIECESATDSVAEGAGKVVLGVRRQDDSTETATVDFTTADGTAKAGVDYLATSGKLTFAPGETHKEIVVPLLDDEIREPDKTFTVQLTNVTGGSALGTVAQTTVTIQGDDLSAATLYVALESTNPIPPFASWETAAVLLGMSGSFVLDNSGVKGAPIRGGRGESVTGGDRRQRELEFERPLLRLAHPREWHGASPRWTVRLPGCQAGLKTTACKTFSFINRFWA